MYIRHFVLQVDIRSVEGEVVAVRRVSRIQKEDELLQKAMRKKSRKVASRNTLNSLTVCVLQVSRQGDWLVFTEKVGILTSQNGVQQVREERVKINSEDLDRLVGLGF